MQKLMITVVSGGWNDENDDVDDEAEMKLWLRRWWCWCWSCSDGDDVDDKDRNIRDSDDVDITDIDRDDRNNNITLAWSGYHSN